MYVCGGCAADDFIDKAYAAHKLASKKQIFVGKIPTEHVAADLDGDGMGDTFTNWKDSVAYDGTLVTVCMVFFKATRRF